jgi:hypothetical protein
MFGYLSKKELRYRVDWINELNEAATAVIRASHDREVTALERRLAAQQADFLAWRESDFREIQSLRAQTVELLDRVAEKLKLVPMSEPMKPEPLTQEQQTERSRRIDSMRRSGPVAKVHQEAEEAYEAEKQRQEDLRKTGG